MAETIRLNVAVPWSLTHYIPLNGFHPLYRCLFDERPGGVAIHAWDAVGLSQSLRDDAGFRGQILHAASAANQEMAQHSGTATARGYYGRFGCHNMALSRILPGHIEVHHTAAFPTLTRPFVLHVEAFAPILSPFVHSGSGAMQDQNALREHYRGILAHPLCLGVFSHIPNTLRDVSRFFSSPDIDEKLFSSRIGLSSMSLPRDLPGTIGAVSTPRFLFINSAHQNPANFFNRGGHVVLRFWRALLSSGRAGTLVMRCTRPDDSLLRARGVDVEFLRAEEGRSIVWVQNYLASQELNALMANAHFFLLPSMSLHSASIMQAMALGAVPVVTDTIGTSVYVDDGQNGIVLEGVMKENWHQDPSTGVMMDHFHWSENVEASLIAQLMAKTVALLNAPERYAEMREAALARSRTRFSGKAFSKEFWSSVERLMEKHAAQVANDLAGSLPSSRGIPIERCLLRETDWSRVFESPPQPLFWARTGLGWVSELGGAFIHAQGDVPKEIHDWSPLAEYCFPGAPKLTFAPTVASGA